MYSAEDLFTEEAQDDLEPYDNQENNENAPLNSDDEAKEAPDPKIVKPKRVVRNPQPKLNAETLKGPKGLLALEKHFDRVKFKGRGYEDKDLNVLLKTYEYWCHRLFPKLPFEDCVSKIESLGSKKAVQTHIKKIRMDMIVDDDAPTQIDSDNENMDFGGPVQDSGAPVAPPVEVIDPPEALTDEQLDRIRVNKEKAELLRQERLKKIKQKAEVNLEESRQLERGPTPENDLELTHEQLERIRVNREKAEQLRLKKLDKSQNLTKITAPLENGAENDSNMEENEPNFAPNSPILTSLVSEGHDLEKSQTAPLQNEPENVINMEENESNGAPNSLILTSFVSQGHDLEKTQTATLDNVIVSSPLENVKEPQKSQEKPQKIVLDEQMDIDEMLDNLNDS